jgi:hypothetical protein
MLRALPQRLAFCDVFAFLLVVAAWLLAMHRLGALRLCLLCDRLGGAHRI